MKKQTKEIERTFNKLKKRIINHRKKCNNWNKGKPCFNCHLNTLTDIEKAIKDLV